MRRSQFSPESPLNPDLSRRGWLRWAGAGVASSLLAACSTVPLPTGAPVSYRRPFSPRPFVRPGIREDSEVRVRVGLRPFRPGGFRVEGERMGDKVVIHNYGHGGGGITLAWGTSLLAMRELPDLADRRAAVLGCGVVGLSTARLLQARGWAVTIYAKDLPPGTTSDVAGGQWAPTGVFARNGAAPGFPDRLGEAMRLSHGEYLQRLGPDYGVSWQENYHLSRQPEQPSDYLFLERWPDLFPDTAVLGPDQHPFPTPYALTYRTLMIEPAIYLPRLMREVREAGGTIVERALRGLPEVLALDQPVVFNCTGLGARELFGDTTLTPVRGQIAIAAPDKRVDWCTHGSGSGVLYMFPRRDGILMGGTFQRDNADLAPDPDATARILREHARIAATMRL